MTFEKVCSLAELPAAGAALAEIRGLRVALIWDDSGRLHAIADECTHGKVSLAEGEVEGCTVECWLHGSRFDLATGRPLTPPATVPVAVYPVQILDGDVHLDLGKAAGPARAVPGVSAVPAATAEPDGGPTAEPVAARQRTAFFNPDPGK
jgi:3-phenylpropionate/trans-cinnamate dioxygenase ferredoxin subunit